jgi:hypothetical protein
MVDNNFEEKGIRLIWKLWCGRQQIQSLVESINAFIKATIEGAAHESTYRLLTEICFQEIAGNRAPSERQKHLHEILLLKSEIRELAQKGKKLASPLAKWVAYFHNPDIVDKDSAWVVVPARNYALQKRPNKPLYVSQILANLRHGYPHLELAASGEIRNVEKSNEGYPELVRDALPPGFSYTEDDVGRILPINLSILDEQSRQGFVTKDKLNSMELVWRPRLNLMS